MYTRWSFASTLLLCACGGGTIDGERQTPTIEITSPADNDVFLEGEDVYLEVVASLEDGTPVEIESATWEAAIGWSADGDAVTVDDLPAGSLNISVVAVVDGRDLNDSVRVEIDPVDGGDGGGGGGGGGGSDDPVAYSGQMNAQAYIGNSSYDDEGDCLGAITFTLLPDDTLTGTGSCSAEFDYFDYDVNFDVTGEVNGGQVSGDLYVTDADDVLPFQGTYANDGTITAEYDRAFNEGDGTLRIWGTFTALPDGP